MDHGTIIQRVLSGDNLAYAELVRHYQRMVYTVCFRVLRNMQDAEEATQDSFVKTYQHLAGFGGHAKFSTWLYSIANNMCKNEYRKNSIREKFQNMKVVQKHETNPKPDLAGFKKALNDFTQSLSEEKKELYVLRFMENLTVPQIAEILDLPEGTVKSRIFYLLKELKDELKIYKGLLTYP